MSDGAKEPDLREGVGPFLGRHGMEEYFLHGEECAVLYPFDPVDGGVLSCSYFVVDLVMLERHLYNLYLLLRL